VHILCKLAPFGPKTVHWTVFFWASLARLSEKATR